MNSYMIRSEEYDHLHLVFNFNGRALIEIKISARTCSEKEVLWNTVVWNIAVKIHERYL